MTNSTAERVAAERVDAAPSGAPPARRPRRRLGENGWFYMAPAFLLVLAVTAYPLYFAGRYSLFETRMWEAESFVGLRNFRELGSSGVFWGNVGASATYVLIGVVICAALGTGLAIWLRRDSTASRVVRAVILIPWITSEVVVAITWRWMLNPEYGPFVTVFERLGLPAFPNLFASGTAAMTVLILVNVWRSLAFPMLMSLAALQAVPREIEEAAAVDGAGRWQRIRHILVPSIMPVIIVSVIVLTINYFNMVALIIDLTGGGPIGATETLGLRLYREAFQYYNVDVAAALTMVMLVINFGLAVWYFRALRRQSGGEA